MNFIFLTKEFYDDYCDCPEIEKKETRPYVQVCIKIDECIYAIPMRSHISHKYAYLTDKANHCGLDFSKTVILSDADKYIDTESKPYIRENEFDALRGKEYEVTKKLKKYINDYLKAKNKLHIDSNKTLCEFSTLKYFEQYLNYYD